MIELLMEGMSDNKGGKETYIINMLNFLDKTKYRITFVAYDNKIAYEDYLSECGVEIVHIPPRCNGLFTHRKALDKLFKQKKIDVVWAHKTSLSACEILSIAKKNSVPVRIIHSHCSSNMGGSFTYIMHRINKKMIFGMANEYLACSNTAAKWFFGSHPSKIMTNGIDLEKFKYNSMIRMKIRKKLNLQGNFVIGHVGRFGREKNHKKLLEVFEVCRRKNKGVKLILCGEGEERVNIERQIKELGIQENVLLLGVIDNVNEILQAMDIFVMPSYFEGLPYALLEAQTAGLKCIVSDTISSESDILKWNHYLSLQSDSFLWAEIIMNEDLNYDRSIGYEMMKKSGFNIVESVMRIEDLIDSRFI